MLLLFLKALLAGVIIAAPTGPTGILCIRRTLLKKDKAGFFTGYGAASADLFYASVAGFGISIVSDFILGKQMWFQLFGGIALFFIGINELLVNRNEYHKKEIRKKSNLTKDYFSGFFLTLSNPITIITFFTAYAIIGFHTGNTITNSIVLVIGSFIGSLTGWTLVNSLVAANRKRFSKKTLYYVNRISGTILIIFGFALLLKFFLFLK